MCESWTPTDVGTSLLSQSVLSSIVAARLCVSQLEFTAWYPRLISRRQSKQISLTKPFRPNVVFCGIIRSQFQAAHHLGAALCCRLVSLRPRGVLCSPTQFDSMNNPANRDSEARIELYVQRVSSPSSTRILIFQAKYEFCT